MDHCRLCTRRQFLKNTAVAGGAVGLSPLCFAQTILAEGNDALRIRVSSRCIFGSVVVTHEDHDELANPYKAATDFSISMNDNCAGVGRGVAAVRSGQADIGTVYRDITEEEKADGLVQTKLGRLCYAVAVSKKNPVNELTLEQTLKIFAGRIQNWKEVGGKDFDILIYRQRCGANWNFFIDQALANADIKKNEARLDEATMSVQVTENQLQRLAVYEMAVTMVPRHFFDDETKSLQIDGMRPSAAAEESGNYPFIASINLVTRKNASEATKQYLSFMSGAHGRELIKNNLTMNWWKDGF